jgi:hypothetical protein
MPCRADCPADRELTSLCRGSFGRARPYGHLVLADGGQGGCPSRL